jgi:hypothetical protein
VEPSPHLLALRTEIRNEGVMAKKAKRRQWTKGDIRELKALARQKLPASKALANKGSATYEVIGKRQGHPASEGEADAFHYD